MDIHPCECSVEEHSAPASEGVFSSFKPLSTTQIMDKLKMIRSMVLLPLSGLSKEAVVGLRKHLLISSPKRKLRLI